jgi:hypothetical protein
MSELERALAALAAEVEWPETPSFELRLEAVGPARPRRRRLLVVAIALALVAVGVAFAVPQARSAILRLLHVGGATVELVSTLPAAEERPLAVGLGRPVTEGEAEAALGGPVLLPDLRGEPRLHEQNGIVSVVLAVPEPVLLSQFGFGDGPGLLKKVAGGSTGVEWVELAPDLYGLWLSGGQHVVLFPAAPPRLAGNVLLWERDGVTYRLEGPELTRERALELARELLGLERR